jgi:putative peptide modification system cyclase
MNDAHQPQSEVPQLRTLLLTDLCDSMALVERLGDANAAELFKLHDALVLELQQRWRGRLIDRSDGLLLLFERPIDGLGFALDYARGLHALGTQRKLGLKVRAGLHVGEVLTWRNSDAAVQVGAKPLEVEGLAKPTAARLMTLARPGQILLSAVAESLTHRAARELGERGERLLWKSHGRWRFKGVPTAQEIYEVGEIGTTPLHAPKPTPKAWRDIPLWRRPAALLAEAAVITAIVVGTWFATRPQPAIAFAERDWVVVGDVRNLTGKTLLDDSLQQAFRISLEQSRYVNLLSDLKVRDTLKLMRRDENVKLDRATASEIALRDGARAVILPTVAEVGGMVKVSAEVVDPNTQSTVYATSQSTHSLGSVLNAVDKVSGTLRESLGEAMKDIQASAPLPSVSTANLDALRAYALGVQSYSHRRMGEATQYYQQALKLDPDFALAYMGLFRIEQSTAKYAEAEAYLERASALRDRLAPRQALYLDAWLAEYQPQPAINAPAKWKLLTGMYPDIGAGRYQYAWWQYLLGNLQEAYDAAAKISPEKEPLGYVAVDLMARVRLAQNRYDDALKLFERSEQIGATPMSRRHASALAAAKRYADADRAMAELRPDKDDAFAYTDKIAYSVDRGDWASARSLASTAVAATKDQALLISGPFRINRLFMDDAASGTGPRQYGVQNLLDDLLASAERSNLAERDSLLAMAVAALLTDKGGRSESIKPDSIERLHAKLLASSDPVLRKFAVLLDAQKERSAGNPAAAIKLLQAQLDGREHFQLHVALRDAALEAGQSKLALEQTRWLASNRGRAYADPVAAQVFVVMNVADSVAAERTLATTPKAGPVAVASGR